MSIVVLLAIVTAVLAVGVLLDMVPAKILAVVALILALLVAVPILN